MRVTKLRISNLRAIETAEFTFEPGFNLIVGVNGVGKTTVLDALGACLRDVAAHTVRRITRGDPFIEGDIRIGSNALTVEAGCVIGKSEYSYLIHEPRSASAEHKKGAGRVREQVHVTPTRREFIGEQPALSDGSERGGRPFAVLFSTNRAVPSERAPSKGVAAGGVPAAYAEAFANRELRLGEFAPWMKVQDSLRSENEASARILKVIERTVRRFLPGYSKLRAEGDGKPALYINHGRTPLQVKQLSDGERGILALVLDLTRRLAQANPEIKDPAAKAEAVVLIDELDLHLHPKWQRQIVHNLTTAFPKCQFIATTHSPQVIGSVPHTGVTLLVDDGPPIRPAQTFGMDSNWILRHIMEADEREPEVQAALNAIIDTIRKGDIAEARTRIIALRKKIGESPDLAAADAMASRAESLSDREEFPGRNKKKRRGEK